MTTETSNLKRISLFGILIGSFGATADLLMLYAPGFSTDTLNAVATIPPARITAGYFLGILAIPLYVIGYWIVYQILKRSDNNHANGILFTGAFGVTLGVTFHGAAGMLTRQLVSANTSGADLWESVLPLLPLAVPLFIIVHIILVIGSIWFAVAIWDESSSIPRWMSLLSPGAVALIVFLISLVWGPLGDWLQPSALNLGHIAFFAGLYYCLE